MESSRLLESAAADSNDDKRLNKVDDDATLSGEENVVDVSGKSWDLSLFERPPPPSSIQGLYVYHNTFHLIPRSIGRLERLKTVKFFANEIEILPPEVGDLVELEHLQLKVSLPGLSGTSLKKLKSLRELELCRVPTKLAAFSILGDISGLKCLTRLSICHFSIRYLPSEIGGLKNLEELDLSFNKLKNLPDSLAELISLKSLRVANNKLVDLPPGISSLRRLLYLDLSNNRLTSLASLNFASMHALQHLDLQYNKLPYLCQIPPWINFNLEGNSEDISKGESCRSSVEVSLDDVAVRKLHRSSSCNGCCCTSFVAYSELPSSVQYVVPHRMKNALNHHEYNQHCQNCLNYSKNSRISDHTDDMSENMGEESHSRQSYATSDTNLEIHVDANGTKTTDQTIKSMFSLDNLRYESERDRSDVTNKNSVLALLDCSEKDKSTQFSRLDILTGDSCVPIIESNSSTKDCDQDKRRTNKDYSDCSFEERNFIDQCSSVEASSIVVKSKRHSDKDLDNPKPTKFRRPVVDCSSMAKKYCMESFCGIDDHLPDGFYDAGRERPFMSLQEYEECISIDSREIILLDREKDEELNAIALSARLLLSNFKRFDLSHAEEVIFDGLPRASVLALLVSDCFGGSDRSDSVLKLRKGAVGSNDKLQPFVCTCSAGTIHDDSKLSSQEEVFGSGFNFNELCENSLKVIKETRNSSVVPLGALRFGVCRHRAALMKYLCDRADPPIPCELVRGYRDFMPHAWNVVNIRMGNSWRRMVVDACYPTDIRDETDPEYYCRYIPLSRVLPPLLDESSSTLGCSFPSPSILDEMKNIQSRSVFHCKFGTIDAAAKIRSMEAEQASQEDIKELEYAFLAEIRILGALRGHDCIVEMYGHQFSSKWVSAADGSKENRTLQFIIVMEYVKGGSLKGYLDKLSGSGEKHIPLDIALFIARDVACALVELHTKHIIHRDVKSENILIDLDCKRSDSSPVVKLSDFDRSVPLHSSSHTCCIAHFGVHPPEVCVGTPRWMAPEVVQAMHERNPYGLEVDIWSYGCLLLELLTLQVPFVGKSETEIYDLLRTKRRPALTEELETLAKLEEAPSGAGLGLSDTDAKKMKLLVDLFYECTRDDPAERPTAGQIYQRLCSAASHQSEDAVSPSSNTNS
ncbi:Mitogen-activated protein kinase kinase kinase YODA [Apostasia shenzhenica]|uniref:Mitogen-activated protein kinase kinase kinase YODA n=1 Tax=Apostasia shenzhenica TaxID=1088818 RepID=A0A2H9ZZV8_9ASPA|nr:Mitogen-activated protein kinase kinase kinase YODA [Apostasia shenzhenica]